MGRGTSSADADRDNDNDNSSSSSPTGWSNSPIGSTSSPSPSGYENAGTDPTGGGNSRSSPPGNYGFGSSNSMAFNNYQPPSINPWDSARNYSPSGYNGGGGGSSPSPDGWSGGRPGLAFRDESQGSWVNTGGGPRGDRWVPNSPPPPPPPPPPSTTSRGTTSPDADRDFGGFGPPDQKKSLFNIPNLQDSGTNVPAPPPPSQPRGTGLKVPSNWLTAQTPEFYSEEEKKQMEAKFNGYRAESDAYYKKEKEKGNWGLDLGEAVLDVGAGAAAAAVFGPVAGLAAKPIASVVKSGLKAISDYFNSPPPPPPPPMGAYGTNESDRLGTVNPDGRTYTPTPTPDNYNPGGGSSGWEWGTRDPHGSGGTRNDRITRDAAQSQSPAPAPSSALPPSSTPPSMEHVRDTTLTNRMKTSKIYQKQLRGRPTTLTG